ncbi:hypothetical protein [Maridesulfovibrio sp.]|uniref:hypothetical protein n=1 Tax=Maridesulfovibrio sp. TaxID=2795000 RepID=UPI0039EFA5D5
MVQRVVGDKGRTEIEYDDTRPYRYEKEGDSFSANVGTLMRARLHPFDPVRGSGVSYAHNLGDALKDTAQKKTGGWVLGHLLNSKTGGLGIPANLVPITHRANMEHCWNVEHFVKNQLLKHEKPEGYSNSIVQHDDDKHRIQYEVKAILKGDGEYGSQHPDVDFECKLRDDNDGIKEGWVVESRATDNVDRNQDTIEDWKADGTGKRQGVNLVQGNSSLNSPVIDGQMQVEEEQRVLSDGEISSTLSFMKNKLSDKLLKSKTRSVAYAKGARTTIINILEKVEDGDNY